MKLGTTFLVGAVVLTAGLWFPATASAQTVTTITYPNDNVTGAALSGRRPGLRTSAGIGTVVARQSKILYGHDGAAPQDKPAADDLRTTLLVDALKQLFTTLNSFFSAANLLGSLSTSTTTTTTGG